MTIERSDIPWEEARLHLIASLNAIEEAVVELSKDMVKVKSDLTQIKSRWSLFVVGIITSAAIVSSIITVVFTHIAK